MDLSVCVSLTLAAIAVTIWFIWRKRRMSVFQRLGIPGPKPNFWTGNLGEMIKKGSKCEIEWIQKYGDLTGYYFGAKPILMVADPQLLTTILVKDFNDFVNKDMFMRNGGIPTNEMQHAVGMQKDQKWKLMRGVMTPSFSVGKLKNMMPIINESIDVLMKKIKEKADNSEPFDIYPLYRKLVLDIVTRVSFGISTNVQEEEDSFFLQCVIRVLNNGASDILNFVSLCFPETEPIPTWLKIIKDKVRTKLGMPSVEKLLDVCQGMIDARKRSIENRRPDLLQNLIDASIPKQELDSKTTNEFMISADSKRIPESKDYGAHSKDFYYMTEDEIKANAMVFIIAGYDTTSVSLAFTTHFMVKYQDVQDKMRSEILAEGEDVNYHSSSSLPYMDQVFSETLRLYPPLTSFTTRISSKNFEVKGMRIPEGMTLQAPLWHLHRDPNYWNEPECFRPERFSVQNKPNINSAMHQPFGIGPRNCIGAQMAKMVVRLTLAHLLNNFRFISCEDTETELQTIPKLFVNYPKKGVKVLAVSI